MTPQEHAKTCQATVATWPEWKRRGLGEFPVLKDPPPEPKDHTERLAYLGEKMRARE